MSRERYFGDLNIKYHKPFKPGWLIFHPFRYHTFQNQLELPGYSKPIFPLKNIQNVLEDSGGV